MSSSANAADKRRFPRIDHVASEQIVRLVSDQTPRLNFILTQNFSASGIKFTTAEELLPGTDFLLYLNPALVPELGGASAKWVHAGDHYLTRVVWVKRLATPGNQATTPLFEVGAAFVEQSTCRIDEIHHLTELLNVSMLERLPDPSLKNDTHES
jgi:hypothetical protein